MIFYANFFWYIGKENMATPVLYLFKMVTIQAMALAD